MRRFPPAGGAADLEPVEEGCRGGHAAPPPAGPAGAGAAPPEPADVPPGRPAPALLLVGALATVYVVWGSTYLAIAIGIETIPPFLLGGVRFLIAGSALYAWSIRRGDVAGDPVGWPQWRAAFVVGGLLLACGNGGVSWGEQTVPSGLAALLVATVPLWIAISARALLGQRLRAQAVVGLVVGFAGVAVLVQPGGSADIGSVAGVAAVLFASLSWGAGSAWSRRAALPQRPLVATAMQMLAGGVILLVMSGATGEWSGFLASAISARSLAALAYLVVFGSIAAFTAYMWLLRTASTTLTSTYAYVNPVVAVILGWAVLAEPVSPSMLLGGAVILVAVALIVAASGEPGARARRRIERGDGAVRARSHTT